jgi:hypothetical protein
MCHTSPGIFWGGGWRRPYCRAMSEPDRSPSRSGPTPGPGSGGDFRCSPWTERSGIDPIGSAPTFHRLVAVEVPQPWPPAVEDMEWVAGVEPAAGTRVQAIVADVGRPDGSVLLTRWDRIGAPFAGTDWLVTAEDVPDALAVLVAGGDPEATGLGGSVTEAPAEILVCGHGARDRCCGGPGTRLSIEVRAGLAERRVRRTSHLGGHRFAPTALTLPDGRMWAHLDPGALVGIVNRTLPAADARERYRGNVGLDAWSQVVEGAMLAERGWDAVDFDELSGSARVEGGRADVTLRWSTSAGTGEREATVEVAGRYPVLLCGRPPSEAEKDSAEYRLV